MCVYLGLAGILCWVGWFHMEGNSCIFFLTKCPIKLIIIRKTIYSYALYNGNLKPKSKASRDFCLHFSFKFNAKHIRNVVVGGTDADCDAGLLPFLFCPISPSS